MKEIISKLERLGFSSYEAKAYYTLLRKHPANGYEISKIGKIPGAKIYDTLKRLIIKGFIVESSTEPGKYFPVPQATLISKVKHDFADIIGELEVELRDIEPLPNLDITINFFRYEEFIDKSVSVINGSQSSLLLSIWPEEAALLADHIALAVKRGVTVVSAVFGDTPLASSYNINLERCGISARARLGKRFTAIAGDDREVVLGELDETGQVEGTWTTTPAIVLVTKEYIKHDIWSDILVDTLGPTEFNKLCQQNQMLSYLIKNR